MSLDDFKKYVQEFKFKQLQEELAKVEPNSPAKMPINPIEARLSAIEARLDNIEEFLDNVKIKEERHIREIKRLEAIDKEREIVFNIVHSQIPDSIIL